GAAVAPVEPRAAGYGTRAPDASHDPPLRVPRRPLPSVVACGCADIVGHAFRSAEHPSLPPLRPGCDARPYAECRASTPAGGHHGDRTVAEPFGRGGDRSDTGRTSHRTDIRTLEQRMRRPRRAPLTASGA